MELYYLSLSNVAAAAAVAVERDYLLSDYCRCLAMQVIYRMPIVFRENSAVLPEC